MDECLWHSQGSSRSEVCRHARLRDDPAEPAPATDAPTEEARNAQDLLGAGHVVEIRSFSLTDQMGAQVDIEVAIAVVVEKADAGPMISG